MGFFSSDSPKVFKSKDEIKRAILKINSLDYRQKPEVIGALIRELDDGGVSREEFKKVVLALRREGEISETDKNNLLALINQD